MVWVDIPEFAPLRKSWIHVMSFLEELERSDLVSTGSPLNQACETRLERQLDEFPVCRTLGLAIHSFSAIGCFSAVSFFSAARRQACLCIVFCTLLGTSTSFFLTRNADACPFKDGQFNVCYSESSIWMLVRIWCSNTRWFYHFLLVLSRISVMANLYRFVPRGIVQLISFYIFPWYKSLLSITEQTWNNKYVFLRSCFIICA